MGLNSIELGIILWFLISEETYLNQDDEHYQHYQDDQDDTVNDLFKGETGASNTASTHDGESSSGSESSCSIEELDERNADHFFQEAIQC